MPEAGLPPAAQPPAVLPPPRAAGLREPGLRRPPQPLAGRAIAVLALQPGEGLTLEDSEGGQAVELLWLPAAAGGAAPAGLPQASVAGRGLAGLLADGVPGSPACLALLQARGIALDALDTLPVQALFGEDSPAAAHHGLQARAAGWLVVATPAAPLSPEGSATATPVALWRQPAPGQAEPELPPPLAALQGELRIPAGTARAYTVKAGEYVQVIDVAGRQCSDFQAFAAHKLQAGRAVALDATLTRTLLGQAYPTPGLPSKAFDAEGEALLELVQDSCGRHDSYATACSPRYYDDAGYPGHVNCSDNFNAALAPHGVPPRLAWEALNFFYNTSVDAHQRLSLDEPWSRPGDHVLLRALVDLVCVSSSCPDDIDAANGWVPTDIHVRLYPASSRFPRAIAHRMSPDAPPQFTRETAFHARSAAAGARFVDYRGHWLAAGHSRTGALAEYWACREAVTVMDLSALRKFEVTGPDAEALLQWTMTRDIRKLAIGQVVYTAICHPHGGVMDDGTVFRLGEHLFRLICGDDRTGLWLREEAARMGYRAWVRSSTEQLQNLAVQGPRSRELLQGLLWTAPDRPTVEALGWFRFTPARLGHARGLPLVVSRTGYTGELGYELFCHPRDAQALWDAVWAAGQPLGLQPMGLEALDWVRIEAGLAFAGHEFDDGTDPFEAGIGFTVPLKTKAVDFVGREALLARQGHARHQLVGLAIDGHSVAAHGDPVFLGRAQVGVVTSACHSPSLQQGIALARVEPSLAALGTALEIGALDGQQKRLPATVVRFPHYDPDKTRVRA